MNTLELEKQASAFQAAAVILAANHSGVLAALSGEGAATAEQLAGRLDLDGRAVSTLCDALVSLGVVVRDGEALAVAPDLRDLLDPSSPASMTHILEHQWYLLQRWGRLDDVLRTGTPAPRAAGDESYRAFILGMADLARRSSRPLWERIDLSRYTRLVDVGGGPGEFAVAALERFPALRATVFDAPAVLAIAREYSARRGVGDRLAFHPGDALTDPIPACDLALVFSLVHSYGSAEVERIAANVAAGLERGGLLVIREFLWASSRHEGPLSTALFAVNMLVGTSTGRCWSAAELEAIFGPHGFTGWRQISIDPRSTFLLAERW